MPRKDKPDEVNQNSDDWPSVLKAWRKRRGFTQKQAAEHIGVGWTTYRQWEMGIAKPSLISPSTAKDFFFS